MSFRTNHLIVQKDQDFQQNDCLGKQGVSQWVRRQKKGTYKQQNQGQRKKEDKSTAWALQDEIRKAKAQLEIRLARNSEGKMGFNTYTKVQRKHGAFDECKRT